MLRCKMMLATAASFRTNTTVHFGVWIGHKKHWAWTRQMKEFAVAAGRWTVMVLRRLGGFGLGAAAVAGLIGFLGAASADTTPPAQVASNAVPTAPSAPAMVTPDDHKHMLMQYCTACHNDKLKTAGMSVVPLDANNLPANQDTWEKVLR